MSNIQAIIMYPYGGIEPSTEREKLFHELLKCVKISKQVPIVVVNRDTEIKIPTTQLMLSNIDNIKILRTWSVDTCQMWLAGWGHVIDMQESGDPEFVDISRVVLLPGDLEKKDKDFFKKLEAFIGLQKECDILIGDFASEEIFGGKTLIDQYGTYPLLANWFPKETIEILKTLKRPRSEFLNIEINALKRLLMYRKFAYEQTLSILIRVFDQKKRFGTFSIESYDLGVFEDAKNNREKYRGALDQVERMERLLKFLWRDMEAPEADSDDLDRVFANTYSRLIQYSSSICENARIAIGNLLDVIPYFNN